MKPIIIISRENKRYENFDRQVINMGSKREDPNLCWIGIGWGGGGGKIGVYILKEPKSKHEPENKTNNRYSRETTPK